MAINYHHLYLSFPFISIVQTSGFTLEVTNTNSSTLIAGIRVLVGSQSVERAPSYVEIFGRTNPIQVISLLPFFKFYTFSFHTSLMTGYIFFHWFSIQQIFHIMSFISIFPRMNIVKLSLEQNLHGKRVTVDQKQKTWLETEKAPDSNNRGLFVEEVCSVESWEEEEDSILLRCFMFVHMCSCVFNLLAFERNVCYNNEKKKTPKTQ